MKPMTLGALLGTLLVPVFVLSPAGAEISQVTVAVDGLGCPFCAYGIEKKLRAVDGVADVEIELKTGLATVEVGDGAAPDVGALRRAVKKAGFAPRRITITAIGTLGLAGSRVLLDVRGSDQRYLLFEPGREDGPPFFDPESLKKISSWAESSTVVIVTGTVRQHPGRLPGLSAGDVKPLQSLSLRVEGMSCERCAARLTRLLRETDGVHRASVSFATKRATIESAGEPLEPSALISVVDGAGFTATVEQQTR